MCRCIQELGAVRKLPFPASSFLYVSSGFNLKQHFSAEKTSGSPRSSWVAGG